MTRSDYDIDEYAKMLKAASEVLWLPEQLSSLIL